MMTAVLVAALAALASVHAQEVTYTTVTGLEPSESYTRCQFTHRCNRGRVEFLPQNGRLRFEKVGVETSTIDRTTGELVPQSALSRSRNAELYQHFEAWRMGTVGFQADQTLLEGTLNATIGAHYNPYTISPLGPPETVLNVTEFVNVTIPGNASLGTNDTVVTQVQYREEIVDEGLFDIFVAGTPSVRLTLFELAFNLSMDIVFNTTECVVDVYQDGNSTANTTDPSFSPENLLYTFTGALAPGLHGPPVSNNTFVRSSGPDNSSVCLFNFVSVYLGEAVRVHVDGDKPLVLMSRATAILDTEIRIQPGTLGGMPGASSWSEYQNNQHGPGSPAVRAYWATVRTFGDDVNEVQTVTTGAAPGQTLRGTFRLEYQGVITGAIPHDASAYTLQTIIEEHWPLAGKFHVTRSLRDNEGGYTWTMTFLTAVGDRAQINVIDELTGIGHRTATVTLIDGNTISGEWTLQFLGGETRPIDVNATAEDVRLILEEDLTHVGLINAEVVRSNPEGDACQAGLCPNGPQVAWGYTYSFTLVTDVGIVEPTSPNDPILTDVIAPVPPTLGLRNISSSVAGAAANVTLFDGFDFTEAIGVPPHTIDSPITMPYGGTGASYGGVGGTGHARHSAKPVYNDHVLTFLYGGSGGAIGGETIHQVLAGTTHTPISGGPATTSGTARGGAGGGVLHVIAVNDVIVGPNGGIYAEGEPGANGFRGGGGGAGGGILISAGGVLVVHSPVSVRGGDGGKGIGLGSRGGGGGGGGRLAGFSQSLSVVDDGELVVSGGTGGLDEELGGNARAATFEAAGLAVAPVGTHTLFSGVDRPPSGVDGGEGSKYLLSASGAQYRIELEEGGAEGTARALRVEANDTILNENGVVVRSPYAHNGVSFTFPSAGTYWIRRGIQAAELGSGGVGVDGSANSGVNPSRVTVYVKSAMPPHGSLTSHWGAHIALHEFDYRPVSNTTGVQNHPQEGNLPGSTGANGPGGPANAGGGGVPGDSGEGGGVANDAVAVIGVALVDGKFKHDANYRHTPGIDLPVDSPQTVAFRHVEADRWYKIDIFMDWQNNTYKVRVDDYTVVLDAPFNGTFVRRLGLYTFHQSVAWFDEVYVGPEDTMNFECPQTLADQHLRMQRPIQSGWDLSEMGPQTRHWDEQRHQNHISRRENFVQQPLAMGMLPFDGPPHLEFHSDLITRTPDGDHNATHGRVNAAAMSWVPVGRHENHPSNYVWQHDAPPRDFVSRASTVDNPHSEWGSGEREYSGGNNNGKTGRFYWYGDHDVDTSLQGFQQYELDIRSEDFINPIFGGIVSCSTNDMLSWRNEGTMIHYSEMRNTQSFDPVAALTEIRAERPKVLWNEGNNEYVMWMVGDDYDQSLRQIAIATSDLPNGPFSFSRTIFPDTNRTVDFTVFQDPDGTVFLARTYYANKTYFLPRPIMQPVWDSVKGEGSTDFDPVVDFGLSYHRAFYHHLYDNIEDTYKQRWRFENNSWRIETGDWVETYNLDTDLFELTHLVTGEPHVVSPYPADERQDILEAVFDDHTFRDIMGQGRPPIESRYKDPTDPATTDWQPNSVPAVKSQTWAQNYQDKNIADNPTHPTVADLLIGPARVVEVRRAKYLSISLVDDDYLDTVGVLTQIEGELENEDDLIVLLSQFGRFGFTGQGRPGADASFATTFPFDEDGQGDPFFFTTEPDWETRHWQNIDEPNDRYESVGTVPDPVTVTHFDTVNFRDKQVSTDCPQLHYLAETKFLECEDLRLAQRPELLTPQVNASQSLQSYALATSTALYEACLVEHEEARTAYQECIRAQLVDFNDLQPWGVGSRECVGGDGLCTRDTTP